LEPELELPEKKPAGLAEYDLEKYGGVSGPMAAFGEVEARAWVGTVRGLTGEQRKVIAFKFAEEEYDGEELRHVRAKLAMGGAAIFLRTALLYPLS
jgi:hypothetical protein